MRICYLINNDDLYLNRYAVDNIGAELKDLGHTVSVINERNHSELLYSNPDLIILVRIKYQEAIVKYTLSPFLNKVPIIYHIDDYIFDTAYKVFHASIAQMMDFCNYITTTTQRLEEHICRIYTKNKYLGLVENTLGTFYQEASTKFIKQKRDVKVITYLSGTSTHDEDWKECENSVEVILKEHTDTELWLVGSLNINPNLLLTYPNRVHKVPLVPYINMLQLLDSAYINLAPLADNELNNCKSPLKLFESGYFGVPTICSSRSTYLEYYHNTTTNVAQYQEEWYGLLHQLLENKDGYLEYQKQAQDFAQPYLVQNKISHIESLYKKAANK